MGTLEFFCALSFDVEVQRFLEWSRANSSQQGPKYTYVWAVSNFLCVVFFYLFIPESKGRSLEELDEIFEAGVSARKFSEYKCKIVEDAKQDILVSHRGQNQTVEANKSSA